MSTVPFKANAARRHHIPRQRHRVTNWAAYDASLRQRGSLTVWFTAEAIAAWRAAPRTTRGGLVRGPVGDPVPLPRDAVTTSGIGLERHGRRPGIVGGVAPLPDLTPQRHPDRSVHHSPVWEENGLAGAAPVSFPAGRTTFGGQLQRGRA